jgi:hypothetical protein
VIDGSSEIQWVRLGKIIVAEPDCVAIGGRILVTMGCVFTAVHAAVTEVGRRRRAPALVLAGHADGVGSDLHVGLGVVEPRRSDPPHAI